MRAFDLNCAPIDQYPVTKVLTESDMTTSELVLPTDSVEEFIVPNMAPFLRNRLTQYGRVNIWVVDDENRQEHLLTMVHHDHHYSIIGWNQVRHSRPLRTGQEIRFGWLDDKLRFIVTPEDNGNIGEDYLHNAENHQHDGSEGPGKGTDDDIAEPSAKRIKIDMCESSVEGTPAINP